jgi:hypothetical protein
MPIRTTFVVVLLSAATAWAAVELRPLAGEPISGDLISLNDKEVVLKVDGKPTPKPVKEILQVEIVAPPKDPGKDAKYTDVELIDGTLLHCDQVTFKGKDVSIKLLSGQTATFPTRSVRSVLKEAHDPTYRQDWAGYLAKKAARDQLVAKIKNKNPATGVEETVLNSLPVTFGAADDKGELIEITKSNGEKASIKLASIHGMIFQPDNSPEAAPLLCKVFDAGANIYYASALTLEGDKASLTTSAGVKIDLPRSALARLDYSGGKLVYLSDWATADMRVTERSTEDLVDHFRRDRNLDDGPLQLNSVHYDKGLSIHSFAQIDFSLGGQFREFKATIGVDDLVSGSERPTIVKIEADGKELLKQPFTRKDKPKDVTLNVLNAKTLSITVMSEELLDLGHHLDLANARVSK